MINKILCWFLGHDYKYELKHYATLESGKPIYQKIKKGCSRCGEK